MNASVIIPCFNCQKTILNTLEAIAFQTTKPKEIIIVDDGSKDKTKYIVTNFSKNNKKTNIKYFYQNNSGPAKARNTGAKKATGEIIVFTDSDCTPKENWLEEMIKPFNNQKVSGVQGAYKSKQKELTARFGQIEIEDRYEKMKNSKEIDWIGSYSAAFRRKEFLALNGYDETFPIASGEDPEFSFRLAKNGGKLIFNPNAIVYHLHPNNLFKYLKTKFFRAYYRPKMYSNHKEKIVNDSYTPQVLKLQILLSGLIIILLPIALINQIYLIWAILIFIITTIPFCIFALKRDPVISLIAPFLIFARSIVFCLGLAYSLVKK